MGEGILGDGNVIPDLGEDVVLAEEAAGVFSEKAQHGPRARPQLHMCPLRGSQLVGGEVHDVLRQTHLPLGP
ncbi:MAG: hypothetical protein WBW51_07755 [Methyloceanibacter sp.]